MRGSSLTGIQIIAEKFGYRRVMIGALAYMSCIFFLHFFAKSLPMLLAAQILIGVPWGSESGSQISAILTMLMDQFFRL